MRNRHLVFVAVPLAFVAFFAAQWALALMRAPGPSTPFAFAGEARSARLVAAAARAGDGTRLDRRPMSAALESAGLAIWDRGFVARATGLPAGGPPFSDLELVKDLAWKGSSVVLGYHAFADTGAGSALRDLAETVGLDSPEWIGAYLLKMEKRGNVPVTLRRAWEAQSGKPWAFSGDGIALRHSRDGRILVLARGRELGTGAIRVRGEAAAPGQESLSADGSFAGWFCVMEARPGTAIRASFVLDLLAPGKELLEANGIPAEFPALAVRDYGSGRVWSLLGDVTSSALAPTLIGPLPTPRVERFRSLDSPDNPIARFQRILVPLVSEILATAPVTSATRMPVTPVAETPATEWRSGRHFIERRRVGGSWEPWFVQGVNLGASEPGGWATEPPTDDGSWLAALEGIAATGFDSVRVYTLLPPAFYRALVRFNSDRGKPIWLLQGIWLDEDAPSHDLLDPAWRAAALAESLLYVDALHGKATIAPRTGKSWGEYRIDASPWLVTFMIGRELLPEEVEATSRAHPTEGWSGERFVVRAGHPVEAFLASLADAVQTRDAEGYGSSRPAGFVSWPTLDPLYHPGAWDEWTEAAAPYHDRASVDFRLITRGPKEEAGFFTGFHVYPNYPDFMIRESRYDIADPTGMERYGAYLDDLIAVLPPVPFIVAEFGLATGYGTAHIHPEGLDHGGLSEMAQARGLARLWRTIARRGAGGGMVFEWSDEWSKKTWVTEPFMIPYQRHQLWHNTIDPEQNYGVLAWEDARRLVWKDSGKGIISAVDPAFFHLSVAASGLGGNELIEIGLDTVPGAAGQFRLATDGERSPQGSEFKVWLRREGTRLVAARLLVAADYDRGSGFLRPWASPGSAYANIGGLVNAAMATREGRSFPELWEKGSLLPLDGPAGPGLASMDAKGLIHLRLPWSRLNISDPSSRTILLDGEVDARAVTAQDAIKTARIEGIGVWATRHAEGRGGTSYLPSRDEAWQAPLEAWETIEVRPRPKQAVAVLAEFLASWRPLEFSPW